MRTNFVHKILISTLLLFIGMLFHAERTYATTSTFFQSTSSTSTQATSTYQAVSRPPDFIITTQDLSNAGFTSIEELKPLKGRFEPPVQYFRVGEEVKNYATDDCDDCSNLLSIYITPVFSVTSPVWILDQNPVITTRGNRTAYKWFIGFRILYITGPGGDVVEKLAKDLRERIVLNKTSH